jgi:phenylalanyl-tRNA synthetase alpha chain
MTADLIAELDQIAAAAPARFTACETPEDVERLRVEYVGTKGSVTRINKMLRDVPADDRPALGKRAGEVRALVVAGIDEALERCTRLLDDRKPRLDITLPGRTFALGGRHPLTIALDQITAIFAEMGFTVADGPEIESDYYNFEALNTPADHPARDMQDTYYITPNWLLRSQTSGVQVREMEKQRPPVRLIVPGRVYRNEDISARSMNQFFQVEGLYVDRNVTFADLKGTLETFCKRFFEPTTKVRFRPSFFPFTEPSTEVDVSCILCNGAGCRVCKYSGWLEILGAGMVDPNVFGFVDYDPEEYTGFAFGMGIDRTTMMRYGVDDIRHFWENDMRFLTQFE